MIAIIDYDAGNIKSVEKEFLPLSYPLLPEPDHTYAGFPLPLQSFQHREESPCLPLSALQDHEIQPFPPQDMQVPFLHF